MTSAILAVLNSVRCVAWQPYAGGACDDNFHDRTLADLDREALSAGESGQPLAAACWWLLLSPHGREGRMTPTVESPFVIWVDDREDPN